TVHTLFGVGTRGLRATTEDAEPRWTRCRVGVLIRRRSTRDVVICKDHLVLADTRTPRRPACVCCTRASAGTLSARCTGRTRWSNRTLWTGTAWRSFHR